MPIFYNNSEFGSIQIPSLMKTVQVHNTHTEPPLGKQAATWSVWHVWLMMMVCLSLCVCQSRCRMLVNISDGYLRQLKGTPDNPFTEV